MKYLKDTFVELHLPFLLDKEELSLRMGAEWLEYKTGRRITARGLQKHIDNKYGRRAERLGA